MLKIKINNKKRKYLIPKITSKMKKLYFFQKKRYQLPIEELFLAEV